MIKSVANINNTIPRCKAGKFQGAAVGKRIKWMSCQYRTTFNNIKSADKLILKLSDIENQLGTFAAALSGMMFAAGERDLYGLLEISEKIEGLAKQFDCQLPVGLKNSPQRIKALYKKLLQYAPFQIDRQPDLLGSVKGFLREQNPQLKGVCHDASAIYMFFFLRLEIPVSFGYRSWAPGKEGHLFLLAQSSNSGLIKIESTEEQELEENYCLADNEIMLNHIGILPLIMAQYGSRQMLRVGDTGSMLSYCRMAREMWPDSLEMKLIEAENLVKIKNVTEAKKLLEELLRGNSGFAPAWMLLAQIYNLREDPNQALLCASRALQIEKKWSYFLTRVYIHLQKELFLSAITDVREGQRLGAPAKELINSLTEIKNAAIQTGNSQAAGEATAFLNYLSIS